MKRFSHPGFFRRLPTVIIPALLAAMVYFPISEVCAAQPAKSRVRRYDREQEFLKRGYTELSGEEAVRFLIGNTIVIRKIDAPKWMLTEEDQRYYLRDARNVIICHPVDTSCFTFSWGMTGNMICLSLPCSSPDTPYSANARVLKAPRLNERTGQIGLYIEYRDNVQSIVKGNATIANFTDTNLSAKLIEVNSNDFSGEIRAAKDKPDASARISIEGPHAASILIGNTFMTDETTTDDQGGVHLCPSEGYYYSPDGRLIKFQCEKNEWSVFIQHWRLKSGSVGVEDDEDSRKFVYGGPIQSALLVPLEKGNLWNIEGWVLGNKKALGYSGNALNFK